MISLSNAVVFGWHSAIMGMRNPMNSWANSDSAFFSDFSCKIGQNDLALMKALIKSGTEHRKFLRMIHVQMDIEAPLYWWKEFDTYKVGTVANSCSTMHKIHSKEFTLDDFSHEHLCDYKSSDILKIHGDEWEGHCVLDITVRLLNFYREKYLETKDKKYWRQMIQLLPSSYNQRATVQLNYAVLRNMYHSRKNHKLDEWVQFCKWIEQLPYSELITM